MFKANTEYILRKLIIKLSLLQHNKLYVHNTYGPDTFDCSGFVWYVYKLVFNIDLYDSEEYGSTSARIMKTKYGKFLEFKENEINKDLSSIKKGDILFFHRQSMKDNVPKTDNKYPGHCGIYLGNNRFIHCSGTKKKIVINDFSKSAYWTKKLIGSKDVISSYNELLNNNISNNKQLSLKMKG